MKKDPLIIALVVLAIFVVLALVWQSIPAAREVTVDDYATDQHGSYLARWWVGYYEVIGTDTTLIDIDTTDSYGWYEITAPTGSYLIYAFPLWDDSTDTSLSRKSYMNLETIVAVDNDTAFFRYAKADLGFIGTVRGKLKEWPKEAYGKIPFCLSAHDGHDIHFEWGKIAYQEGVPITFMVIPGVVGAASYIAWAEAESLNAWGHEVAAHGWSDTVNYQTMWNAGFRESVAVYLEMTQDTLGHHMHKSDSFYVCESWVWPGNARNNQGDMTAKALEFYSNIQHGADSLYHATLESFDAGDWELPIPEVTVIGSGAVRDSAIMYARLDSLCEVWGDTNTVALDDPAVKYWGEHSVGGFYLHDSTYAGHYAGLDTSEFRELCQILKQLEGEGKLWLTTHGDLTRWMYDNRSSIDNRQFAAPGWPVYVWHPEDPDRNTTQYVYKNYEFNQIEAQNYSPGAFMKIINDTTGQGIYIQENGEGTGLFSYVAGGTGRAGQFSAQGDPYCTALLVTPRDSLTYGVRIDPTYGGILTADTSNIKSLYVKHGKTTLGTTLSDSTRMQTATVAGSLTVGDNAAITGDISCDDLTAADSVKGVNVVASTKLWAGAGDFGVAGVDIAGHLNVDGLADFDDEVDIGAAGMTLSGGGNIAAGVGSQLTDFDYGTIKHIVAADSIRTNTQSGKIVSHTFKTSGEQSSGFHGDLTGDVTGTASAWAGSGTVEDSLAALRTDVVNLDATVSTHGDSLTVHTTDIAALQATKVDTNKAYVYRDAVDWGPESQLNASILKGNTSAPWYSPTDTIVVVRFLVNYYGSAAGGEWEIILLHTSGDTISWTDTLTASGWQGYDDQSPSNTIITPADGFYLDVNEISGTTNLTRPSFRVEFYYINP